MMNAAAFKQMLLDATTEFSRLVLVCDGVDYLSAAGLGVITSVLKHLQSKGGELRIAQPSEEVGGIIELSGIDAFVKVFATEDEAVGSY